MTKLPETYDLIFTQEGRGLPLPYLRALAKRESNFNPQLVNPKSNARGLFQVVEVLRSHYNEANKASITKEQLFDPRINTRVACWLLDTILQGMRKAGAPSTWELPQGWQTAALLTSGWNAGWSYKSGLLRILGYLVSKGMPLTFGNAWVQAMNAGTVWEAPPWFPIEISATTIPQWWNADKPEGRKRMQWCASVADLYRAQLVSPDEPSSNDRGGTWLVIALLLGLTLSQRR